MLSQEVFASLVTAVLHFLYLFLSPGIHLDRSDKGDVGPQASVNIIERESMSEYSSGRGRDAMHRRFCQEILPVLPTTSHAKEDS